MIIFILSFLIGGVLAGGYAFVPDASFGIYITFIFGSIAAFIALNKILQNKIMKPLMDAQQCMMEGGEKLQKKVKKLQSKPTGNPVAMQKQLEADQLDLVRQALKKLDGAEELYKWNYLLKKQTETLRFQLYFQLKDYANADKYIDGVVLMDPLVTAMKMTRLYLNNKLKTEKDQNVTAKDIKEWPVTVAFNKGVWKVRQKQGKAFLHNLYAWMLIQNGLGKEAQKFLVGAKDNATDDTLLSNLEALQNSKASKVTLAPYGDQWWALGLQNPPKQKPQRVRQNRHQQGRPF